MLEPFVDSEQKKVNRKKAAEDVIKQLEMFSLRPSHVYLAGAFSNKLLGSGTHTSAQKVLDRVTKDHTSEGGDVIEPVCSVCALGALFVSHIRVHNKVTVEEAVGEDTSFLDRVFALVDYFSPLQLALIEAAYEANDDPGSRSQLAEELDEDTGAREHDDIFASAQSFRYWKQFGEESVEEDSKTMRAIMNNILINDGAFVP